MMREARVLRALQGRALVPKILAVCDDESVLGVPFYVMEHLEGHEVTQTVPAELDTVEDRWRMGMGLVDALVEIHAVDWRAAGLEGFGKPEGYLERQLRRFGGLWEHNKTREIPEFDEVAKWLAANLPTSRPSTIVHGDFRLGNVLISLQPPARIVAVLDWEMSTIGDPLADVGYLAATWIDHDDPSGGLSELSAVTREPGFPTRDEMIARYEETSGQPAADIAWYQILALWKSAIFMEGNFRRASTGMSDDPYLASFGENVGQLFARALDLTRDA
jgi:aminoglycoside phosphotransferase (APT) family kinase protein